MQAYGASQAYSATHSAVAFGKSSHARPAKPLKTTYNAPSKPDAFERRQQSAALPGEPGVHFGKQNQLHRAASRGDLPAIHHLLSTKNLDYLNERDEQGNTPLLVAARDGQLNAVRVLMGRQGIDTRTRNFASQDVYELACSRGHWKVVDFLDQKMGITVLPPTMRTGGFFYKYG